MMRVLMGEYSKETWSGRLERKSLDSVLKLEELGETENHMLDLDQPGYSITCAGRLMKINEELQVSPEHNVRGPNEVAEAIQPNGLEEH
eukprot:6903900-Heterocapsa_arctica.AAC.1